jgi:uncharacterized protein YbgA (DUF1722 family)/uncharacterized protein YbbK (DUF523 family)
MQSFDKPQVVVSRCLGFASCRYDGQTIQDKFVNKLKEYVEFRTVCPEVEIGLGIPRDAIRLVLEKGETIIYQPASGKEYTKEMINYSLNVIESLEKVDGFILKGRSPSCGIKDVKVYLGKEKSVGSTKGVGIFAEQIMKKYSFLAIEEEGRLTNFRIREHFLTKLYTMSRFRSVESTKSMAELVKFHSYNKYLFMAYNQRELQQLGRIVANHDKQVISIVMEEYRKHLGSALVKIPRFNNFINALLHVFGYFSEKLSPKEKEFVLGTFDKYKNGKIPLSVPINLLRSYVIKYEQGYLLEQSIWEPYPEELMELLDTGKNE